MSISYFLHTSYHHILAIMQEYILFEQYLQMSQLNESKARSVIVTDYKPFNIRHSVGNSWHNLDARLILWIADTFKSFDHSVSDLFHEMVIFIACLVLLTRGIKRRKNVRRLMSNVYKALFGKIKYF